MSDSSKTKSTFAVDVTGYEGLYKITNDGKVISLKKSWVGANAPLNGVEEVILQPDISQEKYMQVWLYKEGKRKRFLVHRLVAQHFVANPKNMPHVNHIDRNYYNNISSNLEWCNFQINNEHAHAKHYNLISPSGEVITVYNLNKFCKKNNLNQGNMSQVVTGVYVQYKGWRSADIKRENKKMVRTVFLDPNGKEHETRNVADFCRKNNLLASKMNMVKNGKAKSHAGWSLKKDDALQDLAKSEWYRQRAEGL